MARRKNIFKILIEIYKGYAHGQEKRADQIREYHQKRIKDNVRKQNEIATEKHNNLIYSLTHLHTLNRELKQINYNDVNKLDYPKEPAYSDSNEIVARNNLYNYKPNKFVQKCFPFLVSKKRKQLENEIIKAQEKDLKAHDQRLKEYKTECDIIDTYKELSNGVLVNKDYRSSFIYFNSLFSQSSKEYDVTFGNPDSLFIKRINTLQFDCNKNEGFIEIKPVCYDHIFKVSKSVLKEGELSTRPVSVEKMYSLKQDYFCTLAIRLAYDAFLITPFEKVYVNVVTNQMNLSTGFNEEIIVLSVCFDKSTLMSVNLDSIDASSFIKSLKHNMKFTKKEGFAQVSSLF